MTAVVPANASVPTYCKVNGTLAPALNFEIRLPDKWNGKLYYAGGGGYDGVMTELVVPPLAQGYAEVVSDSEHRGDGMSAAFALSDTFAAQLFGSLSVPTVMSTALRTVTAAYGVLPAKGYFEGCSNGGREASMTGAWCTAVEHSLARLRRRHEAGHRWHGDWNDYRDRGFSIDRTPSLRYEWARSRRISLRACSAHCGRLASLLHSSVARDAHRSNPRSTRRMKKRP